MRRDLMVGLYSTTFDLHVDYFFFMVADFSECSNTGRSPVGRRPTGVAHSKIARVARVVFVLYVDGRASWSAVFDCDESTK